MPLSDYIRDIRQKIGHDLITLTSATALIFDDEDRVLLQLKAGSSKWTLPGGAVEPHESASSAAVRELWEETGLEVDIKGVIGVFGGPEYSGTYPNGDQLSIVLVVFRGDVMGGELCPDGEESLELRYFSKDELNDMRDDRWMFDVLDVAFRHSSTTHFTPPDWKPPARS